MDEVVEIKKSKKWIWFFAVGVVLILVGVLAINSWIDYRAEKSVALEEEAYYYGILCLESCPYSEVYTEWQKSNVENSSSGKGYRLRLNDEYLFFCSRLNGAEILDKANNLERGLFKEIVQERRLPIIENSKWGTLQFSECIRKSFEGDRSCIKKEFVRNAEWDAKFVMPGYENVTLNFTSLTCTPDGVFAQIEIIEGTVEGLGLTLNGEIGSKDFKMIEKMSRGSHELKVLKQDYPDISNLDKIDLFYLVDSEESASGLWTSSTYSTRFCDNVQNI